MPGKIIFVVTNYGKELGETGKKTGWYLPEVAHPYDVLVKKGFEITFVSPLGGKAPMDESSAEVFKEDPVCINFLNNKSAVSKLEKTLAPSGISKPSDYKALFYAGGHGPMFDLPAGSGAGADDVANLAVKIYESGGVLAAVCHGTVGFVPLILSSGEPLVKGKTVTSFTDAEEEAAGLVKAVPFLLESKLKTLGAKFVGCENWACNVQVDARLVTGQNPQSATKVAEEIAKLLE